MAQVNDLLVLGKANFLNEITSSQLLKAFGGIALNESTAQSTALEYVLGIKAFGAGGNVMWSSVDDFASVIRLNASGTWPINISGLASKATADANGSTITSTYAKVKNQNDMIHSGNEWTVVPSGYSGALWLNWQTCGGQNGNITHYNFGNGKGGTTGVTLVADSFSGNAASANTAGSATKLVTPRTIFGHSFDGTANIEGQPLVYGSYNSTAGDRFFTGGIQIRENGLVGSSQSDMAYAPAIGFHWHQRVAASLLFHSDGIFYFRKQNFTDRATIDANVNGSLNGNAATATVAGKISDITTNDLASSSAIKRRIWFCYENNTTGRPSYDDRFTIQTSTGTLFAPIFSGSLSGNATTATTANALASTGYGNSNFTWCQTSEEFAGNSGWASYLVSNHGDGASYYHQIIAMPFWSVPRYRRLAGGSATEWFEFITDENYTSKLDGRYVNADGDTMTGTLSWGGNVSSLNLRTGHDSYDGVISYQTSGNEAMLFTTKNAVTSMMFINGEDTITNMASDRWTKITPGLQIKNNCVSIGRLIGDGATPGYKLDVNGTARFSNTIYMDNGMQWKAPGNITCVADGGNAECSFDVAAGVQWHVWSTPQSRSILSCWADNSHVQVPIHLYVGSYNHTGYALSTSSFICESWIRTTGDTGWFNESYGGGWYMTDGTYLRSYSNKAVLINNTYYVGTTSGAGTGLSLYDTSAPNSYGIHMSYTSTYGKHGLVQGDWATYFCFDGATNRGWIFKQAGTNVASISGTGGAKFDDTVFSYAYTRSSNKAAFMWDKPGSHYTGMGANGADDTIQFQACDVNGSWVDYRQHWNFYGDLYAYGARFANRGVSTSTSAYGDSAVEIREYNFGGAQTETWGYAPRLSFHWLGRVAAQIGLASNGNLYINNNAAGSTTFVQIVGMAGYGTGNPSGAYPAGTVYFKYS